MSRYSYNSGSVAAPVGCYLLILAVLIGPYIYVNMRCTEYVIEYWASFAREEPVDVPRFPCAVGGFFTGGLSVGAALVTWGISYGMEPVEYGEDARELWLREQADSAETSWLQIENVEWGEPLAG